MTVDLEPFAERIAAIIAEFRLRGAERCAAASPLPGFPQILHSVLSTLDAAPSGPWIDIDGGLGGVASWIERTTGRRVLMMNDTEAVLRAGKKLFPEVAPVRCATDRLSIRSSSISVVVVGGLSSRLDSVAPFLSEVGRILSDDGLVAVVDLWSAGKERVEVLDSVFPSLDDFVDVSSEHDFAPAHAAVADVSTGWWSDAAEQVHEELGARDARSSDFSKWSEQQVRLQHVLDSGRLLAAGLVLSRRRGVRMERRLTQQ